MLMVLVICESWGVTQNNSHESDGHICVFRFYLPNSSQRRAHKGEENEVNDLFHVRLESGGFCLVLRLKDSRPNIKQKFQISCPLLIFVFLTSQNYGFLFCYSAKTGFLLFGFWSGNFWCFLQFHRLFGSFHYFCRNFLRFLYWWSENINILTP